MLKKFTRTDRRAKKALGRAEEEWGMDAESLIETLWLCILVWFLNDYLINRFDIFTKLEKFILGEKK